MSKYLKRAFIGLGVLALVFVFAIFYYVIIPAKNLDEASIEKEKQKSGYSSHIEDMSEYKTKEELSDIRLDLIIYETVYKDLMYEIDNKGIDYHKADDIYGIAKKYMLEIMSLEIEDKYKSDLKNALTYICVSMDEYKKGNLDDSVKYVNIAKDYYKKYEKIFK